MILRIMMTVANYDFGAAAAGVAAGFAVVGPPAGLAGPATAGLVVAGAAPVEGGPAAGGFGAGAGAAGVIAAVFGGLGAALDAEPPADELAEPALDTVAPPFGSRPIRQVKLRLE